MSDSARGVRGICAPVRLALLHLRHEFAIGLASKMILAQFVEVNLQLWFIARFLRISSWSFLSHQLCVLAVVIIVAWMSTWIIGPAFGEPLLAFTRNGALYTLGVAVLLFLFPSLVCMSRAELRVQIQAAQAMMDVRQA